MTTRCKDALPLREWRSMAPMAFNFALGRLPERERRIIELRYLRDHQTLDQIGRAFHLSRERVRQVENRAIRLLPVLMRVALNGCQGGVTPKRTKRLLIYAKVSLTANASTVNECNDN